MSHESWVRPVRYSACVRHIRTAGGDLDHLWVERGLSGVCKLCTPSPAQQQISWPSCTTRNMYTYAMYCFEMSFDGRHIVDRNGLCELSIDSPARWEPPSPKRLPQKIATRTKKTTHTWCALKVLPYRRKRVHVLTFISDCHRGLINGKKLSNVSAWTGMDWN